mgnify:CR=1 FL=1
MYQFAVENIRSKPMTCDSKDTCLIHAWFTITIYMVALFPETHIVFVVILRKTNEVLYLKLHTGLLCELYTFQNCVCSTKGKSLVLFWVQGL